MGNDLISYDNIECGDGWIDLLRPIFNYIEDYNRGKNEDERIVVEQVKEKFGGLRFYTNFGTEELWELIRNAEDESYHVCEECGSRENIGYTCGWIKTMCLECAKKVAISNQKRLRWNRNDNGKVSKLIIDESGNVMKFDDPDKKNSL